MKSIAINSPPKERYTLKMRNAIFKLIEASPHQLRCDTVILLYLKKLSEIYGKDYTYLPSCLKSVATRYCIFNSNLKAAYLKGLKSIDPVKFETHCFGMDPGNMHTKSLYMAIAKHPFDSLNGEDIIKLLKGNKQEAY